MTHSNGCVALAAAIVRQAVNDYIDAYYRMMETRPFVQILMGKQKLVF